MIDPPSLLRAKGNPFRQSEIHFTEAATVGHRALADTLTHTRILSHTSKYIK